MKLEKTFGILLSMLVMAPLSLQSQALTDDLVAWYPLDGNAEDFTVNSRHGTIKNSVTPIQDRFGVENAAMHFGGDQSKAFIDVPPVDLSGDQMSVSVYVNPDELQTQSWYNAVRQDGEGTPDFLIQFVGGGSEIDVGLNAGGTYWPELRVPIEADEFIGKWRLLTMTYDGSMIRLYVDAELRGELARSGKVRFAARRSNIGRMTGKEYFHGGLDDVRYYTRALNVADMRAIMQSRTHTGISATRVSGHIYKDWLGNCVLDDHDDRLQQRLVHIVPGDLYALSDANGKWNINLGEGDYSATLLPQELWETDCSDKADVINFSVEPEDEELSGLDIAQHAKASVQELDISLGGLRVRPGWEVTYKILYRNTGTETFSGWLHFEHDQWFEYLHSDPVSDNSEENYYAWRVDALPVGAAAIVEIRLRHLPESPLGETVCNSAWAVADRKTDLLSGMYDEYCHLVRGSYDPNDIAVNPGPQIAEVETDLSYMIRFQNTGTAPAAKVVVQQQLPPEVDLNMLRLGAVSHEYEFLIDANRMATWIFDGIELPDNKADEPASHGYIKYKIQLEEATPFGSMIDTKAEIYFDFNEAVITNTAELELINAVTDVKDMALESGLLMYPNPGSDFVNVTNPHGKDLQISMYDVLGHAVLEQTYHGQDQIKIDLRSLVTGTYLVRIECAGEILVRTLAVEP